MRISRTSNDEDQLGLANEMDQPLVMPRGSAPSIYLPQPRFEAYLFAGARMEIRDSRFFKPNGFVRGQPLFFYTTHKKQGEDPVRYELEARIGEVILASRPDQLKAYTVSIYPLLTQVEALGALAKKPPKGKYIGIEALIPFHILEPKREEYRAAMLATDPFWLPASHESFLEYVKKL